MPTKITIDPGLVREVLGIDKAEIEVHNNEIAILGDIDYFEESDELLSALSERIYGENHVYLDDDGDLVIDIHRFKDIVIEWCAGKGYDIGIDVYTGWGYILIKEHETNKIKGFDFGRNYDYPTRLSAELAAINFCYEQIQKEKK